MCFEWEELPDGSIALLGELDCGHAGRAKQAIRELLDRQEAAAVRLSGVTAIDFSGVQLLLAAKQEAEDLRKRLDLADPSPAVGEAFELLGVKIASAAEGRGHGA